MVESVTFFHAGKRTSAAEAAVAWPLFGTTEVVPFPSHAIPESCPSRATPFPESRPSLLQLLKDFVSQIFVGNSELPTQEEWVWEGHDFSRAVRCQVKPALAAGVRSEAYPPICTIVLDAGTKSGSPIW